MGFKKTYEIEKKRKHDPWISASIHPKNSEKILMCLYDGKTEVQRTGWYEEYYDMWFLDGYGSAHVTNEILKAWQPLTAKYKGDLE